MTGTVTIDRRHHRVLLRSLAVRRLWAARWLHLLVVVALGLAALAVSGDALVGLVAVVVAIVGLVVLRVRQSARSLGHGLGVGQEVGLGWTSSGELVVTDATGRLWLGPGAAHRVLRPGPLVAVLGRDVVVALPAEVVDDDDVAFLEGRGAPGSATEPALRVPRRRLVVDEGVQATLVAARTRLALRSPEVLLWVLVGAVFALVAVTTLVRGERGVGVFFLVVALVATGGCVPHLRRVREATQARHPVGSELRADVDRDGLTLAGPHSTVWTPWAAYRGHRLDDRALRLWRADGAVGVQVLPVGLLPAAALRTVLSRVPAA